MLNFTKKITFVFFVLCFGSTVLASNNPHVIEADTGWVWFGYKKDYIHRIVETQPRFPKRGYSPYRDYAQLDSRKNTGRAVRTQFNMPIRFTLAG